MTSLNTNSHNLRNPEHPIAKMGNNDGVPTTTTITMLGAVLPGDSVVRLDSFPIPHPDPDEVLVSTRASGICGSDLRVIYRRPSSQDNTASLRPEAYQNVIAGHEPSDSSWKKECQVVPPGESGFERALNGSVTDCAMTTTPWRCLGKI